MTTKKRKPGRPPKAQKDEFTYVALPMRFRTALEELAKLTQGTLGTAAGLAVVRELERLKGGRK